MVTLQRCGQVGANPHLEEVRSFAFYVAGLRRLNTVSKMILLLIADCHGRSPPGRFQPSLEALGRLCGCSRKTAWRALQGLDGQHGWIVRDWRGGQKSNEYLPGWRLKRVMQRYKKGGR